MSMKKPVVPLTEAQQKIVREFREAAGAGASWNQVAKSHFGGKLSGCTFRHLCLNDYRANPTRAVAVVEAALNKIRAERKASIREMEEGDIPFVEQFGKDDALIPGVMGALRAAAGRRNEERIVIYQDRGGGGKTSLREHIEFGTSERAIRLRETFGEDRKTGTPARIYRHKRGCSPTWKLYGSAVRYMAAMFGQPGPFRNNDAAEEALFQAATGAGVGLVILEEFQHASADTWTLIKLLCNDTRLVFLILTHPDLFKEMSKRSWIAVDQAKGRTVTTIGPRTFTPATARPWLEPLGLNGDLNAACKLVADDAQAHFGFRRIKEIARFVRSDMARTGASAATLEMVRAAQAQAADNKGQFENTEGK